MAGAAGEPSAKRAKVDEKEDPLVRRKEEVVRLLGRARKGKDNARAKKELVTLCDDFEAKNENLLGRLLPELWQKILDENLHQNDLLALAMTCRFFREKQKDLGRKMETKLGARRLLELRKSGEVASHSLGWFQWVCDTMEILPGHEYRSERVKGAMYEGVLLNYAACQGSVEILKWLMEEKGWEPNKHTGLLGFGGSVKVLEHLLERGYEFNVETSHGAARGGHLEALKFLRGLDPPCPWSEMTCAAAASGGHLEVLKWLRAQDPPCPWSAGTCTSAARMGHLDVLKWARAQDPPCPWDTDTCTYAASGGHLEVLKWLRAQEPPCPWNVHTCGFAAEGGHLEVLKWARSQDPPCHWDEWTCVRAVSVGQLKVLKWLRAEEPPCPWSRSECRRLASDDTGFDHQHIVKWIDQREDESDWD